MRLHAMLAVALVVPAVAAASGEGERIPAARTQQRFIDPPAGLPPAGPQAPAPPAGPAAPGTGQPPGGSGVRPGEVPPAVVGSCVIWANGPYELFRLDISGRTAKRAGRLVLPPGEQITDVAFRPGGSMIGISFGTLYELDPRSGDSRQLAPLTGSFNALATSGSEIYAATTGGTLYRFDLYNGRAEPLLDYPGRLGSSGDLVALRDGTLLATATGGPRGDTLVRLDPRQRTATVVGELQAREIYGLTRCGDDVFGLTEAGDVLAIDPATGRIAPVFSTGMMFWGAAARPELAPTS